MNETQLNFHKAQWIWLPRQQFPDFQLAQQTTFAPSINFGVAVFEKEIVIEQSVFATLKISADVSYILYVDGSLIGRGPTTVGGDYGRKEGLPWRFFDSYTLSFSNGKHQIKILVASAPIVMSHYSSGQNGVIVECIDKNENLLFYSDESWKCYVDYKYVGRYDTDFTKGVSKTYDAEQRVRPLPFSSHLKPLNQTIIKPVSVKRDGNRITFDFGKIYSAYATTTVTAKAQTNLTLIPQEIEGVGNRADTIVAPAGTHTATSLRMHSIRYWEVTADCAADVQAELTFVHYPVCEVAQYHCSDKDLNRVYEVSKRTLLLCMQDYHLDSPVHQEALGCTADYFVQSLINYYTFGITELTRLDILRTAWLLEQTKGKMFHTTFTLIWINWILDYYHYTGDIRLVRECENAMDQVLSLFETYCENDLIENPPDYLFVDWVPVGEFNLHHPPKNLGQSVINCFYYNALTCAQKLKRLLQKEQEVLVLGKRAAKLKTAFNKTFWDEQKGLYFAGKSDFVRSAKFMPISDDKRYFTVHANALAVLYGIADESLADDILIKTITDDTLIPAQPSYFMHFVLEALDKRDLFGNYAFSLTKPWVDMVNECDSGMKEKYLAGNVTCDYSHAVSGTLAYHLIAKTLGVKFECGKPKYVTPILGPLSFAEGVIPVAGGEWVKISVQKQNGVVNRTITLVKESRSLQ